MKKQLEKKYCYKLNTGFTLAEVLITLGIIGITAALTLPSLIISSRNKQLETALKNGYSTLSHALKMYEQENGEPIKSSDEGIDLKTILMSYLNVVKDCGKGTDADKSWIPHKAYVTDLDNFKAVYTNYNGTNEIPYSLIDDGQFVINNGMLVLLENDQDPNNKDMRYISVDVNGYKKSPNRLGQDLFMFQIDNNGQLVPMGAKYTDYYSKKDEYCSNTSTSAANGLGCTAKALYDTNFFKKLPR